MRSYLSRTPSHSWTTQLLSFPPKNPHHSSSESFPPCIPAFLITPVPSFHPSSHETVSRLSSSLWWYSSSSLPPPCSTHPPNKSLNHVENLLLNLSFNSLLFCDPPDPSRLLTLRITSGTGSSLSVPLSQGCRSGEGGKGFRSFFLSLCGVRYISISELWWSGMRNAVPGIIGEAGSVHRFWRLRWWRCFPVRFFGWGVFESFWELTWTTPWV